MADMSKFLNEAARFVHADRPDVYPTVESAHSDLTRWFADLSDIEPNEKGIVDAAIGTAGFELQRWRGEDSENEYRLVRQVISFTLYDDGQDGEPWLFDWTKNSSVVGTVGLDVPEPLE